MEQFYNVFLLQKDNYSSLFFLCEMIYVLYEHIMNLTANSEICLNIKA
jgi:hypothetical protein